MPAVSGVYAAAVTPRRDAPEIDLGSLFELIDFLARGGVDGIALMTATGEFPHFSIEDRTRLISLAVKRSRVPVLAGASHSTLDGALTLAREAAASGAAALLLMPPHFFPYSQEEVRAFYLRFAERFKGAAPVLLDNAPKVTSPIAAETAAELLATGQFAGMVESGEDFERLVAARAAGPFDLIAGNDATLAGARRAGAVAIVSAAASAVPELLVALDRALREAREERAGGLEFCWQEFIRRAGEFPEPMAVREVVSLRGVRAGGAATPLAPESAQRLARFGEWFQAWWPAVQKEIADV